MSGDADAQFVAGIHSVRSALRHGADRVQGAWVDRNRRDRRHAALVRELQTLGIQPQLTDRQSLERMVPGANHQGIVIRTTAPAALQEPDLWQLLEALEEPPLLLVLDGVKDPHNLGACLRTADAAGVQAVIAPRDGSTGLTPVAMKVASGGAETVPFFQVTNLARVLKRLGDDHRVWIVGAAGESEQDLFAADFTGGTALVLGGEGEGLRRLTREHCDQLVRIPMVGQVESLNVSVAAGICLFEALRQRQARPLSQGR